MSQPSISNSSISFAMAALSSPLRSLIQPTATSPDFDTARIHAGNLKLSFHGNQQIAFKPGRRRGLKAAINANTSGLVDVPLLTASEIAERYRALHDSRCTANDYLAMYSSIYGGITTDPIAMMIPLDDHMVHRGHGVFDTAAIVDGHLYELDQHLDRFLRSASMAKIKAPLGRSEIKDILIKTVAASKCSLGSLRYWLSPGPGDFLLSSSGCPNPALYAIVIRSNSFPVFEGIKVITSSIPMKTHQFAVMKNVNYLPNALSKMEAEEKGAYAAIWLDDEGFVAEGPNMNVAFLTRDNELLMPHFDKILSGCTAKRVFTLAEDLVRDGRLSGIRFGNVTIQEAKTSKEIMLLGSGVLVKPVVQWDDDVIGDAKEGPVAQTLYELLLKDMRCGPPSVRILVPY